MTTPKCRDRKQLLYSKALDGTAMLPIKIEIPGFSGEVANSKHSREEKLVKGYAPCCGVTKGAISATSCARWRSSRFLTSLAWSRCLG